MGRGYEGRGNKHERRGREGGKDGWNGVRGGGFRQEVRKKRKKGKGRMDRKEEGWWREREG